MTLPSPRITVLFGLVQTGGDFFSLDDPIKGLLDDPTYVLADVIASQVEADAYDISIQRGRFRELDEFDPGTATVALRNFDRDYDPAHTASPFFGELTAGKRVTISIYNQTIYSGVIEDWRNQWTVDGDAIATFTAVDELGQLARKEFDEWTTTAGQTAGPRLAAILDRSEVAFQANRALGTGVSVLQGENVSWGSNVLNYAQLVALSDWGRFYSDRNDVVTFKDRHSLLGATVKATFRDDGTDLAFHGITTEVGSTQLFNRVGVDREEGILQTVNGFASQIEFGVRSLVIPGLLLDSDGQSRDLADFLLATYKDPTVRVTSITVNVTELAEIDQALVASLELGQLVRVVWTPPAVNAVGDPVDQTLVIEGIDHSIPYDDVHVMTFRTSLAVEQGFFILDDATYGVLDTSVLAF